MRFKILKARTEQYFPYEADLQIKDNVQMLIARKRVTDTESVLCAVCRVPCAVNLAVEKDLCQGFE